MAEKQSTKTILESLYKHYNHRQFIPPEPLQFVYRHRSRCDMEAAGILAAFFAYGSVKQIEKFLNALFSITGSKPADFIREMNKKDEKLFAGLKYRFNTAENIVDFLRILQKIFRGYENLEEFFLLGYKKNDKNIIPAAINFAANLKKLYGRDFDNGMKFLLSDPSRGGTCKRLFLFLRWFVRSDEVDTGLWKNVDKAKLIVPVDVHMGRLSRILRLHSKHTYNLKTAIEITEGFKQFSPGDPVKYDFALCRIGILENCTGKANKFCPDCMLNKICKNSDF